MVWINVLLIFLPLLAPISYVTSILLAGEQTFLKLMRSFLKKLDNIEGTALIPRDSSSWWQSSDT
ncbi:hypothetical protein TH25_25325 [Thalassospira profundimaris]|uniref:Uncharacterized protein n=1 Tax=Thalassospira profundimaris TaxID=502049 RepID=A0A367WD06_9PROT|nr:hypothetical protein TH25_25325 [Thalassospira profundimaris]